MPHLEKHGIVTRLVVDDKPFIILGGELGNSSFTSVEYMEPVWSKLKALNINTVLAPVYRELIEPEEGRFDNNQWKVVRHLNGVQTHQGRHIRIFKRDFSIIRFELYNYN
jgi:beta-galactosidase GanA